MEQGLCIAVQRLDFVVYIIALLSVIKGHKEGSLLYGIQRLFVLTTAEVGVTGICPRGPRAVKGTENTVYTSGKPSVHISPQSK